MCPAGRSDCIDVKQHGARHTHSLSNGKWTSAVDAVLLILFTYIIFTNFVFLTIFIGFKSILPSLFCLLLTLHEPLFFLKVLKNILMLIAL